MRSAAAICTALLALAAASPASAWTITSAQALGQQCHATDPAKRAACVGYVAAIYDLQFAPNPPPGVCLPANLDPELLAEVVTAYVDTHDDGPAPAAVAQAIVRFFPCTPGEKQGGEKPAEKRK